MVKVRKFVLKDVRCFQGRNEFEIRPMTFLVGENSTGKSTVLGCFQALSSLYGPEFSSHRTIDFNEDPHRMGSFSDIARKSSPPAKSFSMGFALDLDGKEFVHSVTLKQREDGSEPVVHRSEWRSPDGVAVTGTLNGKRDRVVVSPAKKTAGNGSFSFESPVLPGGPWDLHFFDDELAPFRPTRKPLPKRMAHRWVNDWREFCMLFPKVVAPVRAKPKRTYDPLRESDDPEGIGMPMTLRNMSVFHNGRWKRLQAGLADFGKKSGLFERIDVKHLGNPKDNPPFQILVKTRGAKVNLIDVGRGVGQILPVLVDVFNEDKPRTFLIQEPGTLLHPRGQAEFVSLLARRTKEKGQTFLIETHGDDMINRIRIDIMNKRIKSEDVSLIYLEEPKGKDKGKVEAHNISFDYLANFEGAPNSFRRFFLNEADRLLGFKP